MIEDINWNYLAKTYGKYDKNNNHCITAYDKVRDYCLDNFTINETILLYNFIVDKREEIKKVILDNYKDLDIMIGDDTLWDLSSHIIGLGEAIYDLVKTDPKIVKNILPYVVENYEYGITAAINEFYLTSDDEIKEEGTVSEADC